MKIAIYQVTHNGVRNCFDDAGRRPAEEASRMVMRGVVEEHYLYCGRVKIEDPIKDGVVDIPKAMEMAFEATQNDIVPWSQAETTIYAAGQRMRSTNVGDIFVSGEEAWIVASCGFTKLANSDRLARVIAEGVAAGNPMDALF